MIKLLYRVIKWLVEAVWEAIQWIYRLTIKYIELTIWTLGVSFLIVIGLWKIWDYNLTKLMSQVNAAPPTPKILEIYQNIARVTEVTDRVPPIAMWADIQSLMSINAFTTGQAIYFTFAADLALNDDEKALIMGHEIAHVILHHTDNTYQTFVESYDNENELMADNLGAVWADKAGYDVCKGREIYKKFYQWGGNSLNATHPPNTIRYENLEHYCKPQ